MISTSILSIKDNLEDNIKKLDNTSTDFIHVDIMDGVFVNNNSVAYDAYKNILSNNVKSLDVHLMVSNVKKYVDDYKNLNPKIITFHYEAINEQLEMIEYIKSLGIKVGMAIKPSTAVSEIVNLLPYLDLVLVMSVEPGYGGQEFIYDSLSKIDDLSNLRSDFDYKYLIEVDGGVNDITAKLCINADIIVVGSFITDNENYEEYIKKIKKSLDLK